LGGPKLGKIYMEAKVLQKPSYQGGGNKKSRTGHLRKNQHSLEDSVRLEEMSGPSKIEGDISRLEIDQRSKKV